MKNQDIIQDKYVIGSVSAVGDPRRKWEDRVFPDWEKKEVAEISRPGGDTLIVGIVADGVGSADFGARGAQLAIDTVVEYLKNSHGDDIPSLIEDAIMMANKRVYVDNQQNDGDGYTTLVVSIIYKERCYIGNVGDSRAYWVQLPSNGKAGRVLQLTRDHSYFNIYGGDEQDPDAGILVNAIGKKEKIEVDCGFYLKKNESDPVDLEKAYQLGLAGLPLRPGDSIVLCSDGLIKNSPDGVPYISPDEILGALQSEYQPRRAAIKLASQAEGRRPDDNVSVVTIQYLSREIIKGIKARSAKAERMRILVQVGLAVLGLMAIAIIIGLGSRVATLTNQPTHTPVYITNTPVPSPTITPTIAPGQAVVHEVNGNGSANVRIFDILSPGTEIFSNETGVRIVVGEQGGGAGVMYWFPQSAGTIDFEIDEMKPLLRNGALFIAPNTSPRAEVRFSQEGIVASVTGSRMIVRVINNEIVVYCFEGVCRLDVGLEGRIIPIKSFISYNTISQLWSPQSGAAEMSYDEMWQWNVDCNGCMQDIIPTPTPTVTPTNTVGFVPPKKTEEKMQAPPATTQAPPATTQAPPATTQAPPATTQAPPATTEAPPATTEAPPATTEAPSYP